MVLVHGEFVRSGEPCAQRSPDFFLRWWWVMTAAEVKVHLSVFESWLASRGRSERTIKTYVQALSRTLGSLEATAIKDVTPIDLAGWRRQRASEAKPATVNVEIDALRQFFRFSLEAGLVQLDPTDHLRRVPQVGGVAPRWLDRKEQHRLIRAAQQARQAASTERQQRLADRDAAIVALMLHAGLRVSEVCMLNTADVILSERKGAVTVRQGKGGKRREVPLNNEARQALARWKERLDVRTTPGYLPDGLELMGVFASACDGDVFNVATEYFGPGQSVKIYTKNFTTAVSTTPAERMQAVTVVGKPAVLITEPPVVGSKRDGSDAPLRLLIVEPFGLTEIRSVGITQEEIFKIAGGLE